MGNPITELVVGGLWAAAINPKSILDLRRDLNEYRDNGKPGASSRLSVIENTLREKGMMK